MNKSYVQIRKFIVNLYLDVFPKYRMQKEGEITMRMRIFCLCLAAIMALSMFPSESKALVPLSQPTQGRTAVKKVLKPGLIDKFTVADNNEILSDYATPSDPSVQAVPLSWAVDPALTYWGYSPGYVYVASHWAGAGTTKSLTYRVLPNTYICIPVMIRMEYALEGITPGDFALEVSEDGTAWETATPTVFSTAGHANSNVVHYLTVRVGSRQTQIRITFPPQERILLPGKGQDWLTKGAIHIGMAKASWTNITAATGSGSGDPVKNWYEDASLTAKPNANVTLSGNNMIVTKAVTEAVSLRDIITAVDAVNCSLEFYSGTNRITDFDMGIDSITTVKATAYCGAYFPIYQESVSYTLSIHYQLPPPTRSQGQEKRVLKPGIADVFSYRNAIAYSDYATLLGAVQGTSPNWSWSDQNGTDVRFWGYAPGYTYTLRNSGSETNGVQYEVLPGSYIAIPVSMRNEYWTSIGTGGFTVEASSDGVTWTAVTPGIISRTFGPHNHQALLTVHMADNQHYLRALFPPYAALFAITPYDDWFNKGSIYIGPAKASWTAITSFDGVGAGDPAGRWYEDAAISVKENSVVSIAGNQAVVAKMANECVTLQNVADCFQTTNCRIRFYSGATELTDLTAPASSGIIAKAVCDKDAYFPKLQSSISYTLQMDEIAVTRRPEPAITAPADKLVLEPGQMDAYHNGVSDYATLVGGMSGKAVETGLWYLDYDNAQYWGYQPYDVYTLSGNAQDVPGQYNGVSYRVVEGSYICIPYQIHHDHWVNLVQNELAVEAAGGDTWTKLDAVSCFDIHANSIHTFYVLYKIPFGHNQLRVKFPSVAKLASTHNRDWVSNGTFSMGMPKASLTPVTAASGANSGDPVTVWNGFDRNNPSHMGNFYTHTPGNGQQLDTDCPTFSWSLASGAESYTLVIEKYESYGDFALVMETSGIPETSYTITNPLECNGIYRWRVYAVKGSNRMLCAGMPGTGAVFMTKVDALRHPANYEIDYEFQNAVSEPVLKNYLARSMIHSLFDNVDTADEGLRMIYYTGTKYVGRALAAWGMGSYETALYPRYQELIAQAHSVDPDIVFEACIFETTFRSIEQIAIPSWVFEAFGQPVVTRNFDYESMLFTDGTFVNHWGSEASVPDMTRLETQMWFYYRACCYIDAGFEGLHMGQVHLMGRNDTGFACWQSVLNKIRAYASEHAGRKFVFINAHTHGVKGPDGKLLFDFHSYPMRGRSPSGSVAHAPSESNPQEIVLQVGYHDSIYQKSLGGITPSGWSTASLPYFVELDNFGQDLSKLDQPTTGSAEYQWWGLDEISWFANQPKWYRTQWLSNAYQWVKSTDSAGFMEMPGTRTAALRSGGSVQQLMYHANSRLFLKDGFDDELTIRNIWTADRKAR